MLIAGGLIAGAVILAPWIYVNGRFAAQLAIVRNTPGFIFRPENCDTWWGRFMPFPYDAAAIAEGLDVLGTPYLEAQLNVVLLIVALWNLALWRRCRADSTVSGPALFSAKVVVLLVGGWFLFLTTLSVSPEFATHFQFMAPYVQYAYRLVSHSNAALLVAVLASGAAVARLDGYRRFQAQTQLVATLCLVIAILGVGIKLKHAAVAITPANDRPSSVIRRQREVTPDYTLPGSRRELTDAELRRTFRAPFKLGEGEHFGEPRPLRIEQNDAGWFVTNGVVFPWVALEINGQDAQPDQLARSGPFLAVLLPAGQNEVRMSWRPDPAWLALLRLSQAAFGLVLLVTIGWAMARGIRRPSVGLAETGPLVR